MDKDLFKAGIFGDGEYGVEMFDVAVDSSVGNKPQEMQGRVLVFRRAYEFFKNGIREKNEPSSIAFPMRVSS